MTTQHVQYTFQPNDTGGKYRGVLIVAALHLLLAWAVVSGTAKKGFDIIKKPLEAVVIQEVIIPPPPPPPPPVKEIRPPEVKAPKVDTPPPPPFIPPPEVASRQTAAPAIASVETPPATPSVIAPPPVAVTPAVEAPAAPAKPNRTDMSVACPTQVAPEMPKRAVQDGTVGVVRAQALIRDGAVREVTILSGPRIFHATVKAAMMQYKCSVDSGEVLATQEFNFKVE